jgi:hypothetical protein
LGHECKSQIAVFDAVSKAMTPFVWPKLLLSSRFVSAGHLVIVENPAGRRVGLVEDRLQRQVERALAVGQQIGRPDDLANIPVEVNVLVSGGRGAACALRQFRNFVGEPPVHRLAVFIECGNIHRLISPGEG